MSPRVTVVVPTYQGEAFVRATLDSVLAQTYTDYELVVCDDGSTDGTLAILGSYGDRLRLVKQANRGVAAARNRAAETARGEFLAFLDHDDLWEPELLATLVPLLSADSGTGLVYSDALVIDKAGLVRGRRGQYLNYHAGEVFDHLLHGNFIPVETTLMRTALYRELGGCDVGLRYLEDYELCLRVARRARIGFHPGPLARYRVHDRNLSHDREPMLVEWISVLERLRAPEQGLSPAQIAVVLDEEARLALDLAWRALRRRDVTTANRWIARSGGRAPLGRRIQVRTLWCLLRMLPQAAADAVLGALPKRKLYGVDAPPTDSKRSS
ncbi:MAG: glycosyltransferase [Planctomycetota bacterium]|nr:glycosyltransferase [Planctomycetota bacterium]